MDGGRGGDNERTEGQRERGGGRRGVYMSLLGEQQLHQPALRSSQQNQAPNVLQQKPIPRQYPGFPPAFGPLLHYFALYRALSPLELRIMEVPIQYPWFRRAFSHRLPDLYSGEALPDLALGWPFTWPFPLTRTSFPRRLNWADRGHTDMHTEKDRYVINLDVKHFSPEEINVTVNGDLITVQGKHEERQQDDHGFVVREFVRKYKLPGGVASGDVTSSLSCDGVLTIHAPRCATGQNLTIPITYEDGPAPKKK